MGGSVVVRSCPMLLQHKYRVTGVAVIDVVEGAKPLLPISHPLKLLLLPTGSAIEALPHMHSLLNARPEGFQSVEDAIEWQYVSHRLRFASFPS